MSKRKMTHVGSKSPQIRKAGPIRVLEVCRDLLAGGRKVGSEWHCGSLSGGGGDKCRVHLGSGRWSFWPVDRTNNYFLKTDLMKRKSGKDIVDLVMAATGLPKEAAAIYLERFRS